MMGEGIGILVRCGMAYVGGEKMGTGIELAVVAGLSVK